jgi:hypothetical protein
MTNIIFIVLFLFCTSAFASNETIDVDQFLRTVDLTKIIHTNRVLNLEAQMSDPKVNTTNIDDMTDFLALTSKGKGVIATWIAEFDGQSNILDQKAYQLPWIGVDHFIQNQIPPVKLQDGLQLVKSCIATKLHKPAPEKIHRVVLYKTIQTKQIIYDYIFAMPEILSSDVCQEILYVPDTGDCEMGLQTLCHATVNL